MVLACTLWIDDPRPILSLSSAKNFQPLTVDAHFLRESMRQDEFSREATRVNEVLDFFHSENLMQLQTRSCDCMEILMIDITRENVISLTTAAKLLPARRGGRRPHVSCLYRWTVAGFRGIVLDSVQVGGTRCTSVEAIQRFCQGLTDLSTVPRGEQVAGATSATVARRADRAIRDLENRGL